MLYNIHARQEIRRKKIVSLSFECFMTGDCLVYITKENDERVRMQLEHTYKVDFQV